MNSLFPPTDPPEEPDEDIPVTLDHLIAVFLHRWSWRDDKAVIEKELRELITEAKKE